MISGKTPVRYVQHESEVYVNLVDMSAVAMTSLRELLQGLAEDVRCAHPEQANTIQALAQALPSTILAGMLIDMLGV